MAEALGGEHGATGLVDLLIPFAAARSAAVDAVAAGGWLDAALLVAGCTQVVEDHLQRSEGLLDRVAVHLTGGAGSLGAPARIIDGAAASVRSAHRARPALRQLQPARDRLLELAVELAAATVVTPGPAAARDLLQAAVAQLGSRAGWPEELDDRPLRLPSSFRSFDQHPEDVAALVARYADRHPERDVPVLVAGIRTSGSYLGPFAAAELRRLGYQRVELVTLRAGERLDRGQRARAAACLAGRSVVIDDPPVSGGTVRDCIRTLEAAGFGSDQVSLLLALPDGWGLPPILAGYQRVVLPGADWRIGSLLEIEALTAATARLLEPRGQVLAGPLVPVADPFGGMPGGAPRTAREHRRAWFRVLVTGEGATAPLDATLVVQGVGVGLFGRHDAAVAARLGGLVPDVLGVSDGVLFQLVGLADAPPQALTPAAAAAYVHARHEALRVEVDRAEAMDGRKAAWEVAAMIVGGALGRADVALRIPVLHPLVRSLLHVDAPSVVDGRMTVDRWLPPAGGDGPLVKVDHAEGAFSNRDLWSYDPVFDLAAIGDELDRPAEVLAEWDRLGGAPASPSRWLLHRLVHAWDQHRLGALAQPAYGRRLGAALVDHVGALLLDDLPPAAGPWCVTDVDGVLETGVLAGASAPGWAGGSVLRALAAHGYRVVPATGRSAPEVAGRVAAWHLPAGIAEYGAALVIGAEVVDLRTTEDRAALDRARAWLAGQPGVVVDPGYRYGLRAWRTSEGRERGPLSPADVAGARQAAGAALTAVPGDDQTDVVPAGCSKQAAVRALLARLDPGIAAEDRPLALAAGDGPADTGLLALGRLAVVPSHAPAELRALGTVPIRRAYQAGLAEGVERLLGHAPGSCATCAARVDAPSAALLGALSVREAGPRGIAPRLARLAASVAGAV